ncbi:MAG TPA: alkaline phosphatase family protein [Candidatus Baltobacteraceae bacterium]|nr:alkaline phosphatase family protein [Candidatus Baltobacteraceae bacterium]
MSKAGFVRLILPAIWVLSFAGCGGGGGAGSGAATFIPPAGSHSTSGGGAPPIQHVVIIFQENRTPDNLFHGLPGADVADSGVTSNGRTVALVPVALSTSYDLDHSHNGSMFRGGGGFLAEYDKGAMDGFDREGCAGPCPSLPAYAYVRPSGVQPYFQMAEQYTFADRMFQSNAGPSFPAHQYIISGTSSVDGGPLYAAENVGYADLAASSNCAAGSGRTSVPVINIDTGIESGSHAACFDHRTMFDVLDEKRLTYKYYANYTGGFWNGPSAISHIRFGPDWSHISMPNTNVFSDIAHGELPAVSWVTPSAAASDHPGVTDGSGPSWVASVVNAIGNSPYWNTTAIFVTWDDWGGWYDHVKPPQYNAYELGFRVPLIVISPYAKRGYVSHVQHEFGSILHFTEEQFGLTPLGYTDVRADDLSDCFDFSQPPARFTEIRASRNAAYFMRLPPSNTPVDND